MIMTLHGIGFDNQQIGTNMRLYLKGESVEKERLNMLNEQRRCAFTGCVKKRQIRLSAL